MKILSRICFVLAMSLFAISNVGKIIDGKADGSTPFFLVIETLLAVCFLISLNEEINKH
jgi:hypothetical protein